MTLSHIIPSLNISVLSLQLLLLSNLTNLTSGLAYQERFKTSHMRLSSNCSSHLVRLDEFDKVELTSNVWPVANDLVQANLMCTSHFMTGNRNQGICISRNDLYFQRAEPGVQIRIYTSKFGPERTLNFFHPRFKKWCTEQSLVSVELTSTEDFYNQKGEYRFSFSISNVTKAEISKTYNMDSFKQCNLSHVLESGQAIKITGQRYPPPSDLPSSCLLRLSTSSKEEYDELCIQLERHKYLKNCVTMLKVDGFNERFWPASEVLGCNDTDSKLRGFDEMCSKNKHLTLNLTRLTPKAIAGMSFTAVVKVKRHSHWETISQEQSELKGLNFMKSLIYFVACVDSVAGIMAAILAKMIRKPRSFWKDWAESFVVVPKREAVHYEVNYPEVSGCQVEEITEAKPY
ncbi:hypothetical protein PoB_006324100 [Plakobranchus ocellatus]|uniref:Uncharacterized protein n=1 Tax=Plakobranchus ocellatus TaxID=259542 RepID=A0AAV4CYD3_9GAST|nr:hypothetical protein PoB_006324100 [Plakobranchus ocellatus]